MRQFPNRAARKMAPERIDKHQVGVRPRPWSGLPARKIMSAARRERAPATKRNEDAHRSLGGAQPFAHELAERGVLLRIGAHQQDLDVVLEELAAATALGDLADPPVGEVEAAR